MCEVQNERDTKRKRRKEKSDKMRGDNQSVRSRKKVSEYEVWNVRERGE